MAMRWIFASDEMKNIRTFPAQDPDQKTPQPIPHHSKTLNLPSLMLPKLRTLSTVVSPYSPTTLSQKSSTINLNINRETHTKRLPTLKTIALPSLQHIPIRIRIRSLEEMITLAIFGIVAEIQLFTFEEIAAEFVGIGFFGFGMPVLEFCFDGLTD